jgi:hypothetical protein
MSKANKQNNANVKYLGVGHWREKRGTVNWVSCAACEDWFHVEARLTVEAEAGRAHFHCPHCGHEFEFADARELVLVPSS